jgi:4'-phosphopantetheinyl transferase EntD
MIQAILPSDVVAAEALVDVEDVDAALAAEERPALARAVDCRRGEYATVRYCARQALTVLGVPPAPILSRRREPLWPDGVVGSMTHCEGYRAAAVGRVGELVAIGIDAEPNLSLPVGVLARVATLEERRRLDNVAMPGSIARDRLLFSAKEAVYKAWFPLARRELAFKEAEIVVDADGRRGRFAVSLLVRGPDVDGRELTQLSGLWRATSRHLLTAVVLRRAAGDEQWLSARQRP